MSETNSRSDAAVETFVNSSELTQAEAEVYVLRELAGYGRQEIARQLGKEASTVDTLRQRYEDKELRLPPVSKIETTARIGEREQPAVVIWFENGAALRYVWDDEQGEIVEQSYLDGVVHDKFGVGGERDELAEFALETLAEYINVYQDDVEACRQDWPHVFEGLTGYSA